MEKRKGRREDKQINRDEKRRRGRTRRWMRKGWKGDKKVRDCEGK